MKAFRKYPGRTVRNTPLQERDLRFKTGLLAVACFLDTKAFSVLTRMYGTPPPSEMKEFESPHRYDRFTALCSIVYTSRCEGVSKYPGRDVRNPPPHARRKKEGIQESRLSCCCMTA